MCATWLRDPLRRRRSAVGTSGSIAIEPKMRWSTKSTRDRSRLGMPSSSTHAGQPIDRSPARAAAPGRSCRGGRPAPRSTARRSSGIHRNLPRRAGAPSVRAGEPLDEVLGRALVPPQRALVEHLDARHRGARHGGLEAGAHDLDLGQLRHGAPVSASGAAGRPRPRARRPSRPASCSSPRRWRSASRRRRPWRGSAWSGRGRCRSPS